MSGTTHNHHRYCECRACRTAYRSRTRAVRGQIRSLLASAEAAVSYCPGAEDFREAEAAVLEAWKLDSFEAGFEFEIDRVKHVVMDAKARCEARKPQARSYYLTGGVL